jgi:GNAT superfamily N-acetyltransferase
LGEQVPFFEDALMASEEKLSAILGEQCKIGVAIGADDLLVKTITLIDHEKFRPELQYDVEELLDRIGKEGFVLFLVSSGGRPIAFLYGYSEDSEKSIFFLDTIATLIEGKGIGSTLVSLALLYSYDVGYASTVLFTEDEDEKGRRLRQFYEHLGFQVVSIDPRQGVCMRHDLNPHTLRAIYQKYLRQNGADQGSFTSSMNMLP